jgi:hypothetical protein
MDNDELDLEGRVKVLERLTRTHVVRWWVTPYASSASYWRAPRGLAQTEQSTVTSEPL